MFIFFPEFEQKLSSLNAGKLKQSNPVRGHTGQMSYVIQLHFAFSRLRSRVFLLCFSRWRFRRPTRPPPPLPPTLPPPPPPPRRVRRVTRRAKGGRGGRSTSGRWSSSSSAPCRPDRLLLLPPRPPAALLRFPLSGLWEHCCLLWWDDEVPCSTGPAGN